MEPVEAAGAEVADQDVEELHVPEGSLKPVKQRGAWVIGKECLVALHGSILFVSVGCMTIFVMWIAKYQILIGIARNLLNIEGFRIPPLMSPWVCTFRTVFNKLAPMLMM